MKRIRSICFILYITVICFIGSEANPGDVLWAQCGDITTNYGTIRNVCVNLLEAANCALNVSVSQNGNQIFMQTVQIGIIPQVCGTYKPNSFITCNVCGQIKDNPNNASQQCLFAVGSCAGIPIPQYTVGCFPKSTLGSIVACKANQCPNNCSGHGTCNAGTCNCPGWYGSDCSSTYPFFERCVSVNQLSSDVCVRVKFDSCQVQTGIYFADYPIYNTSFPIGQITKVLAQDVCVEESLLNCQTCLSWDQLTLNDSTASGCGTLGFECLGDNMGTFPVGCFVDNGVLPKCFICPNNCSKHGTCDKGTCICNGDWAGDDCSVPPNVCTLDCGDHGHCSNGVCACDKNYGGSDCSSFIGTTPSASATTGKGASTAVMVVVPLLVVLAVSGGIAAFFYFKNKRGTQATKFLRLEIHDGEENEEPRTAEMEMSSQKRQEVQFKIEDDN